jgi:transposase
MAAPTDPFAAWLDQAQIHQPRLTADQRVLLQAAFRFRQSQGDDYYSTRLLGHFLLHCGTGLKVAQLARLLGVSRPTASRQQGLSSKEAVQQAHHRMDGRPYGKLLPRYAGAIASYLLGHPEATRAGLIDFIGQTFGVRVSRIALYKFLKKYGLDRVSDPAPVDPAPVDPAPAVPLPRPLAPLPPSAVTPRAAEAAPPFCAAARSTLAPS